MRIPPTDEQLQLHAAQMMVVVQSIVRKSFITEMDLLRLQKALLLARMSANKYIPPGGISSLRLPQSSNASVVLERCAQRRGRKLISL